MIPFFRKIRYRLAKDNQFLKYSRYAIGEIVLVVVGILIALQINNWNEARMERRIEHLYFERLSADLRVDIGYFNKRIEQAENDYNHLNIFISQMYDIQKNLDEIKILFKHLHLNTDPFSSSNSTFQELLSTGDFRTFQNDSLKKIIVEYYRVNDDFINQMEEFNKVCTNLLVENAVINPNITSILAFQGPSPISVPITNTEFEYINNPESYKFKVLKTTVSFYRRRNIEHLQILNQMKMNAEKVFLKIEEQYILTH